MGHSNKLKKKRALIVEDQAEMRAQLKSMLERLELGVIDSVVNGEDAIQALRIRDYDVVFIDYELGRGKDGQQVLEEARHAKLLREVSSFIMVTAAQTVEMVMGALEYHPDGYITKPVTFEDLSARIDRILKTKGLFYKINTAIDKDDKVLALEESKKLIQEKPKIALPVYRIQGKILLSMGKIEEAEATYKKALEIREVDWAKLGLGKVYYYQQDYDRCIRSLDELSKTNKRYVEAMDWLAKAYEAKGELKKSQKILERAIEESPKAILRQTELARVARTNEDWPVATQAARRTVSLGKNSCHKKPENYIHLVEALQTQLLSGGLRDRRYISTEITKNLEAIRNDYPQDNYMLAISHVLDAQTNAKLQHTSNVRTALDQALKVINSTPIASLSKSLIIKTTLTLAELGEDHEVDDFLATEHCTEVLDEDALVSVNNSVKEIKETRVQARIDKLNNEGVEYFERGELTQAIEIFNKAVTFKTASYSVLLNAIQAHIAYLQQSGLITESLNQCNDLFEKMSNMELEDRRYPRFKKLKTLHTQILKEKR